MAGNKNAAQLFIRSPCGAGVIIQRVGGGRARDRMKYDFNETYRAPELLTP